MGSIGWCFENIALFSFLLWLGRSSIVLWGLVLACQYSQWLLVCAQELLSVHVLQMVFVCRPIHFRDSVKQEAYILFGLCRTVDAFSFHCQGILREVRGPGRVVGVVLMTAGEQKLQARLSRRAGLRNRFTGVLCKLCRLTKIKCLGAVSPLITFALSFFPSSLCLSPPPFFF